MSLWRPNLLGPIRGVNVPARAYVFAAGHVTSSGAITNSFNVSASTLLGTGLWGISFVNPAPDANYTVIGQAKNAGGAYVANILTVASTTPPTASSFVLQHLNGDASGATDDAGDFIVFASA